MECSDAILLFSSRRNWIPFENRLCYLLMVLAYSLTYVKPLTHRQQTASGAGNRLRVSSLEPVEKHFTCTQNTRRAERLHSSHRRLITSSDDLRARARLRRLSRLSLVTPNRAAESKHKRERKRSIATRTDRRSRKETQTVSRQRHAASASTPASPTGLLEPWILHELRRCPCEAGS